MEYTKLGNTDIEISKLCVGCMSFGKAGTSEEYLGRALKKHVARDKVVIASKVYFNPGRLSAEAIHREIDGTLKRLGTDYLDLYIIHRFDYETPIEETMQLAARDNGWTPFSAMCVTMERISGPSRTRSGELS